MPSIICTSTVVFWGFLCLFQSPFVHVALIYLCGQWHVFHCCGFIVRTTKDILPSALLNYFLFNSIVIIIFLYVVVVQSKSTQPLEILISTAVGFLLVILLLLLQLFIVHLLYICCFLSTDVCQFCIGNCGSKLYYIVQRTARCFY